MQKKKLFKQNNSKWNKKFFNIKYLNKIKGFGLLSNNDISKGDFICEYIGEIISKEEAERKIYMNYILKKPNYILQIREFFL